MATRIKDGIIPYTGGQGIEITNNHVINVLLRELNNLIQVNGDRELYVDLQLPDGIQPSDTFPVGVTTGKILAEDGWQQSGIILNWKTTSGDYVRLIYANDGKLYYDPGTGVWRLLECTCNTRTFYIRSENDLERMQQAIEYHESGKNAILRLWDDNPPMLSSELPGTFLFISEKFEESPTHPGGYDCYEFAEPIARSGGRRVVEIHKAFQTDPDYGEVAGQVFEIKVHNERTSYFYSIPVVGADITALWKDLYANRFYERKINAPEYFRRADASGSWEHWFISGMADDGGYPTFSGTITAERDGKIMTIAYSGTFTPEESVTCDSIEIKDTCNTKTFYLEDVLDLATAQEIYDWYLAGKNPIISSMLNSTRKIYFISNITSSEILFRAVEMPPSRASLTSSYSNINEYYITLNISSNTVTSVSNSINHTYIVEPEQDYGIPYTPQYAGSPATKKYVDDSISSVSVKVDSTAPNNPTVGLLWYDTTNSTLNVYDGSAWQTV